MYHDRSNGVRQQPPKQPLPCGKQAASPLTPRLAPNSMTPTTAAHARATSPKRLAMKTLRHNEVSTPSTARPTPPMRSRTVDNTTPTAPVSGRRPGPSSTASTPTIRARATPSSRTGSPLTTTVAIGTPSSTRPRLAAFDKTPNHPPETTPVSSRAKSVLGPTIEKVTPSPLSRNHGLVRLHTTRSAAEVPMFFHADEAKMQEPKPRPPLPQKTSSFFYADGREDDDTPSRLNRGTSPVLSHTSKDGLSPVLSHSSIIQSSHSAAATSPTLSSTLSAPLATTQTPFARHSRPLSPLAHTNGEKHPNQTLHVAKRRDPAILSTQPQTQQHSTSTSPNPIYSKPDLSTSPGHVKSSSFSAIIPESPGASRKRSVTWNEAMKAATIPEGDVDVLGPGSPMAPLRSAGLAQQRPPSNPTSPIMTISSPKLDKSPTGPDLAVEARRERKVLDLEISNSSLLAINRSLEREIKKQKTELKRFRRLSRAGRFSDVDLLATEDDADPDERNRAVSTGSMGLPPIHGAVGRPSSPFDEDATDKPDSDMSESGSEDENDDDDDDEDNESHDDQTTSHGSVTQVGRQRAKDERRLRRDLRKHRELLLDTARTNRSLQRCLTWTEDLIKHGRKALDNARVAVQSLSSTDDDLGKDLDPDALEDFDPSSPEDQLRTPIGDEDTVVGAAAVIESLMGIGSSWSHGEHHDGGGLDRAERDSGVEIVKQRGENDLNE